MELGREVAWHVRTPQPGFVEGNLFDEGGCAEGAGRGLGGAPFAGGGGRPLLPPRGWLRPRRGWRRLQPRNHKGPLGGSGL